jgi:hypothetical protein
MIRKTGGDELALLEQVAALVTRDSLPETASRLCETTHVRVPAHTARWPRDPGGVLRRVALQAAPMITPSVAPFGYRMQADDTAYEIERLMIDAWRTMSPAEKARHFRDACRAVDQLARAVSGYASLTPQNAKCACALQPCA